MMSEDSFTTYHVDILGELGGVWGVESPLRNEIKTSQEAECRKTEDLHGSMTDDCLSMNGDIHERLLCFHEV